MVVTNHVMVKSQIAKKITENNNKISLFGVN